MKPMKWKILAAFAFLTMHLAGANAEKIEGETPFLLLGSSRESYDVSLKSGDAITSTQMVYADLVEVNEDIIGFDANVVNRSPKILISKGAQLFRVTSNRNQKNYCSVDNKPTGALEGVFVINADKHTCFIDSNNDGKFEYSYDLRTKFSKYIPIYYDVEVTGNALVHPYEYTEINPAKSKLPIWLDVYLQRISDKGRTAIISVRMRTEDNTVPFTFKRRINLTGRDETIQILGSRITLMNGDEKTIKATIHHGIARQNFSTQRPAIYFNVMLM